MSSLLFQTNNIFVIASTDRPASLPNVLRTAAYFDCSAEVEIGAPSKNERLEILKSLTRNWNLAKDVNLKKVFFRNKNKFENGLTIKRLH